jgi:hypothetical protein
LDFASRHKLDRSAERVANRQAEIGAQGAVEQQRFVARQ